MPLSIPTGSEPAKLNVNVAALPNSKEFSFKIQNLVDEGIIRYEVAIDRPDAPHICGVTMTVETPKGLRTLAMCAITTDPPEKDLKWKVRMVLVKFANGFTWKPF